MLCECIIYKVSKVNTAEENAYFDFIVQVMIESREERGEGKEGRKRRKAEEGLWTVDMALVVSPLI